MSGENEGSAPTTRIVSVDKVIYSHEAILKTAHRFTGKCFVRLRDAEAGKIEISLHPKSLEFEHEMLVDEFMNELLDQQLRTIIAKESLGTRDLITAHALSKTAFIRPDLEVEEPMHEVRHDDGESNGISSPA
jgi:His-Xaa-Ser system protein HxsD